MFWPLAQGGKRTSRLGGRASIARGGPKTRRNRQQNYNVNIVPDQGKNPKKKAAQKPI
jgi:hypothetical protein